MDVLIGFVIAVIIALTGVGAGTITAPLLILFLHVPVEVAVSTALAYSAVVKLIVVPVQMWRKQVSYRVLGYMLLGGLPGVVLGSILFAHVVAHGSRSFLYAVLGAIIVFSSGWHIYRYFVPSRAAALHGVPIELASKAAEMGQLADVPHRRRSRLFLFRRWSLGDRRTARPHHPERFSSGRYRPELRPRPLDCGHRRPHDRRILRRSIAAAALSGRYSRRRCSAVALLHASRIASFASRFRSGSCSSVLSFAIRRRSGAPRLMSIPMPTPTPINGPTAPVAAARGNRESALARSPLGLTCGKRS